MATNYVSDGQTAQHTAAADISSGDVVVLGATGDATIGVAMTNIANGATGTVRVRGVFSLPKADAAVITAGESVVWDSSAGAFDDNQATPASGDVSGSAVAMESKGATTGENILIMLTGVPGTLTA